MQINSVLIIGCGGTGQFLLPPLIKLLKYHPNGTQNITIVEGDYTEAKNSERQVVKKVGINKAISFCVDIIPTLKIIPEFINNGNVTSIIEDSIIQPPLLVIPSVDNMATRFLILKTLGELRIDYIWLCPGNDYESYITSLYSCMEDIESHVHPFKRYVNLAEPIDNIPGGCLEEQESSPQLIAANLASASCTINYLTNILDSTDLSKLPQEIIGSVHQMKQKPIGICPDTVVGLPVQE